MGIYRSVSAAYGIAGEGDVPTAFGVGDVDPYGGTVDQWLIAHGYPLLGFSYGGDSMSGPGRWCIYVKGTEQDIWSGPGDGEGTPITQLSSDETDDLANAALDQIIEIRKLLNHEPTAEWLVLYDVS